MLRLHEKVGGSTGQQKTQNKTFQTTTKTTHTHTQASGDGMCPSFKNGHESKNKSKP